MSSALAQVTISRMRFPLDRPEAAGLRARIDSVNRLADQSKGFIWRLTGAEADAGPLQAFDTLFQPFDPARVFLTLSMWESPADLRNYVFHSLHAHVLRLRRLWIDPAGLPNLAMWWMDADARPTIAEAARRWRHLCDCGPTREAFTFTQGFAAPSDPNVPG